MSISALQLPYLIEWIMYYQIQGAHRVAICDLMSTDKCGPRPTTDPPSHRGRVSPAACTPRVHGSLVS